MNGRKSVFERFRLLAPWAPIMVFFARRPWRERWSALDDVFDDPGPWSRDWGLWGLATLVGIPAGIVVLLFEPGATDRWGGAVCFLVCLVIFWVGCKALDRRANDRRAEDLARRGHGNAPDDI